MNLETHWQAHVTVAAVVARENNFLFVEESIGGSLWLNQPAGHWERNEILSAAMVRETYEETGYTVAPLALLGIYTWQPKDITRTYLRIAFSAEITDYDAHATLDQGIVRALWLSPAELAARHAQHRSPLVMRCVQDYLSGKRYPLDLISDYSFT